jgi:hypothetical protein
MIQNVEELRSKLQLHMFTKREVAVGSKIPLPRAKSS